MFSKRRVGSPSKPIPGHIEPIEKETAAAKGGSPMTVVLISIERGDILG